MHPNDFLSFSGTIPTKEGGLATVRLLRPDDGDRFGRYLDGLGEETRRRYGPHPLNAETAHQLCATLNPEQVMRWVAVLKDEIIAYTILELGITQGEAERYPRYDLLLDPALDCTVAPSVADAYQSQGIGIPLMQVVIQSAREIGRRYMVLMGGTQATNARAVHVYRKLGFEHFSDFEYPAGVWNYDMLLRL